MFSASVIDDATGVNMGIGFLGVALAFGLTVVAMAYAVGHISGGHFNPAVTLGAALAGRLPWKLTVPYWIAQLVGGVAAGGVLLAIRAGLLSRAEAIASSGYDAETIDREIAAEAVQEGFVSAFRRADSFRGDAQVTTWLHRIVVNDYVNSALTAGFLFVVVTMVIYGVLACRKAYLNSRPTVREYPEAHDLTPADDAADVARA